jgi:hypothetical protein
MGVYSFAAPRRSSCLAVFCCAVARAQSCGTLFFMDPHDPQREYTNRLTQHQNERDSLAQTDSRLSDIRLYVVIAAGVAAWLAFGWHWFSPWALLLFAVGFTALAVHHERVVKRLTRSKRVVAFYAQGLARLEDNWRGKGNAGTRFLDPKHTYAIDLDLFGEGSLFELLCTARTRAGEECLAAWLLAPAAPDVIRARQAAVAELAPRLGLREDLALLGEDVSGKIQPLALAAWGEEPILLSSLSQRRTALVLAGVTLLTLGVWALGWGAIPFYAAVVATRLFDWPLRARVKRVRLALDNPLRDLGLLAEMLARWEREPAQSPRFQELLSALNAGGAPPSVRIRRLQSLAGSLEAASNQFLGPISALFLWATQYAFALEAWRAENGPSLRGWLRILGELEALNSLAGYAYERPADPFPEVLPSGAVLEAVGLCHPLLPNAHAVPNDLALGANGVALYIVSGSNMSGKSTLLRALGVAVVLALAGAPVRAKSLRLSPLSVGASIRTQDSLQGGISRFYAEILRLRQIVEVGQALSHPPLFFLIDEILHGTNSHDRRLGTEAVARALVQSGAIGLLTTHDLALAVLAEDSELSAANIHFADQMTEGRMTFDYHLRPGVVTQSNAIALMRAVGLDV